MSLAQQMLNPLFGASYIDKVRGIDLANLIGYWPGNELSGTNADNAEGTAARDGTFSGVSLNAIVGPDGQPAGQWDGANDYCDVYSTSINTPFDEAEGTLMIWAKVSGSGVWTDSTARRAIAFAADGSNQVYIARHTVNNQLRMTYEAAGTAENLIANAANADTDWHCYLITWSVAADEVKGYEDGTQFSTTRATLGTWSGALATTLCNVGASSTVPASVWDGYLAHAALWNTPLTATQISNLALL